MFGAIREQIDTIFREDPAARSVMRWIGDDVLLYRGVTLGGTRRVDELEQRLQEALDNQAVQERHS